ncbi:MAG: phosphate/phosphite/phosphonate ABC transporter substrate-binding protein [Leptolyngbyaceae bacterium]|nr:phosphate/phosphite/phosphonate ABC transporter substrate-binding protein [Leptolyngbyaceae bacterium]
MDLHSNHVSASLALGMFLLLGLSACQKVDSPEGNPVPATLSTASSEATASSSLVSEDSVSDEQPIRIGVLAIDSALSVHQRYAPLVEYLSHALNKPFELVTLTQESQFTAVERGEIDFIINNSLAAVQVQRLYDTEFLVTHSRPQLGTYFSALIIVRADSSIQTLEDLRGKRVACVDFETAAAGCLFQVYHLRQNNIDAFREFGAFLENPSQDSIVFAVLNGTLDAGFIRTGQLEKMVANDLIDNLDNIRVLEPVGDSFVYAHTTALYPEWPIAALPDTDPQLSDAVQSALLSLSEGHSALAAAKVERFTEAVDYQSIHDLIETLQLRSWDVD